MRGGIDYRALRAELAAADGAERRRRIRQVGAWIRASGQGHGPHQGIGIGLTAIGLLIVALDIALAAGRAVLVVGVIVVAVANIVNLSANRRAFRWRRAHPFEQWRTSEDRRSKGRD